MVKLSVIWINRLRREFGDMSVMTLTMLSRAAISIALLCCLEGCAKKYHPVRGSVTLHDGTPLSKGLVIFERVDGGPALTARGDVQPDGRFQLSTETPGDGVPVGRYKAIINPLDGGDVPDEQKKLPFDVKHVNIKTTDLEFAVQAGPNEIPIKLAPPKPRH